MCSFIDIPQRRSARARVVSLEGVAIMTFKNQLVTPVFKNR